MEHCLTVVGIGPGHPDYVLPAARCAIAKAGILAGGTRALRDFAQKNQRQIKVDGDIRRLLAELKAALQDGDVVVMVSGDPGYYSLLEPLRREFLPEQIRVIPGLSSVQLAFAKLGMPWQNARLISAHGRCPDSNEFAVAERRPLALLTDPNHHPAWIARCLLAAGWPGESRTWLCRNLSYDDECILAASLAEILAVSDFESCVMVVMK